MRSIAEAEQTDVDLECPGGGLPLFRALSRRNVEVVRILVDAGADVNARDSERNPILYRAILEGHVEIVRILVDAEANVNARDAEDKTLLQTAVLGRNAAIVKILVDAGAR